MALNAAFLNSLTFASASQDPPATTYSMNTALLTTRLQQATFRCLFQPVVRWAVRSSVGYTQAIRWLKPLFLREAQTLLQSQARKVSSSALVLASGLHRSDIKRLLGQPLGQSGECGDDAPEAVAITLPQQILAHWMLSGWPESIPYKSAQEVDASGSGQIQFLSP
jgi:hypothetical protein